MTGLLLLDRRRCVMAATKQNRKAANTQAAANTVESFLADFPLQKTNDNLDQRLKSDPSRVNTWFFDSGHLVKAGEDIVVRTNNDTFYKGGYADNRAGPVLVSIQNSKKIGSSPSWCRTSATLTSPQLLADGVYALVKDN